MPIAPPKVERMEKTVFSVICEDGPEGERLRDVHLGGHLKYVEDNHDRYLVAGPMRMPGEQSLIASMFLIFAETLKEAEKFMQGDPYISEGIYETITYREISPACGQWMGGVIWDDIETIRKKQRTSSKGVA